MKNKLLNPLALVFELKDYISSIFFVFAMSIWIHIVWIVPFFAIFLLIYKIIFYFTYRYSILEDQLLIKHGLFFKKELHMPYERIQNIHRKQWFFLKPFHLESVSIDNASHSDSKSNIDLAAINELVAETLEHKRKSANNSNSNNEKEQKTKELNDLDAQYSISNHSMNLFALTSFRAFFGIFIIWQLYSRYSYLISDRYKNHILSFINNEGILIILIEFALFLIFAFLFSYISIWIQYYQFNLSKKNNDLTFSRGLFKKETVKIKTNRIQSIDFNQNIIRRWLNLTTVKITIISDKLEDSKTKDPIIFPILNAQQLYSITNQFLDTLPETEPRVLGKKRYSIWLFSRNSLWCLLLPFPILSGGINFIIPFLITEILVIILCIFNGFYRHAHNGVNLTSNNDVLVIERCRFFNRHLHFINWHKIQSITLRESIWMQNKNLAHLKVSERRGNSADEIVAKYIDVHRAKDIYNWYQEK
ncbi:PH domain-containing protein [Apilactobacillus apisilvae]|uniref:PH domain-containing protein n=1 Tax=Apilactobacillus apisilvae TaxID=2923364 RepID=A0ABY4PFR9_9LACO|nr:PH domain-containing protein [Apilactobacillus apisilvae]UQS84503.1 PH domain-containing protein [Apilactobacillus apisilvae]